MEHVRAFGYKGLVAVIPNPTNLLDHLKEIALMKPTFLGCNRVGKLGFLGRLHPRKKVDNLLTLCEAMSQGVVPIVLNSFSAAEDIVKDGSNGLLVPDAHACCQKMLLLASNSQRLIDMSINAVDYTHKYNIKNIISQWEALLKDCR